MKTERSRRVGSWAAALALGALGVLGACAQPPAPPSDKSQAAVEEIMAADRAFNDMAQAEGLGPAFAHFMDAVDGTLVVPGADVIKGEAAIRKARTDGIVPARLLWEPAEGYASTSGDFGATWGTWRFIAPAEEGGALLQTGKYVTVWRKNASDEWRGIIDTGVDDPPLEGVDNPIADDPPADSQ